MPHNLISNQESPVPLLKFQMAPRLKILIASGSKKEPRYTLLVSQKSRQTNSLQVPQQGPCGEGGPFKGHFAYLSRTSSFGFPSKGTLPPGVLMESVEEWCPITRALQHIFQGPSEGTPSPRPPPRSLFREREASSTERPLPSLKVPGRYALLQVPQNGAPMEGDARLQSLFLHVLQGPQQGSPPSRFP